MTTNNVVNSPLSGTTGTGNFVGSTSPTLVTPTLGAATATSVTFSPTTSGIVGTTTNDDASSGKVGEYITASKQQASSVSVSSGNSTSILSITLSAGDWNVTATGWTDPASGTIVQRFFVGISTTDNTLPTAGAENNMVVSSATQAASNGAALCVGPMRISVNTNTTVYMVMNVAFTVSTMKAYGFIGARRVR